MAEDLQASLQNYLLQLQQVDAALSIDADNDELKKLKKDLEEVVTLTKDLIKQQLVENSGGTKDATQLTDEEILKARPHHNFQIGDPVMAMSSDDGNYYEAVIEDITLDGEQVSVKFEATGQVEVTVLEFLKPIKNRANVKKKEAQIAHKKQMDAQREYLKKKKLKKQQRNKQLEAEREVEKKRWLAFTTTSKKKGYGLKKSIFASPDTVAGRVGIGTCGVSGLPMTEYSHAEKRKKGV